MLRAEFPLMLTNVQSFEKDGKKTNIFTVVSLDDGNSMKLFTDKLFGNLDKWSKYLFDISINSNAGKTYFNLNGVRPLAK